MKKHQFIFSMIGFLISNTFPAHLFSDSGVVQIFSGEALVGKTVNGKTEWKGLKGGDSVEEGSLVKTQKDSKVEIVFADKLKLQIFQNSEVMVSKPTQHGESVVDLKNGMAKFKVDTTGTDNAELSLESVLDLKFVVKSGDRIIGGSKGEVLVTNNLQKQESVVMPLSGEIYVSSRTNLAALTGDDLEEVLKRYKIKLRPGDALVDDKNGERVVQLTAEQFDSVLADSELPPRDEVQSDPLEESPAPMFDPLNPNPEEPADEEIEDEPEFPDDNNSDPICNQCIDDNARANQEEAPADLNFNVTVD